MKKRENKKSADPWARMKKKDLIITLDGGPDCDLSEVLRHVQMTRAQLIREIKRRIRIEARQPKKPKGSTEVS